ncbi:MAG: uracil-DNA glycosylase [Methylobacter sp.]|nr:uracil-DNA glycosylase [Methylobacter sp.]
MDNATRLQYLEAMGIDVWLPRADNLLAPNIIAEPTDSWEVLQAEVAPCTRCALCKSRSQTVFGSGNKHADWMIVGEAPGQSEDRQGLPFVGTAGQLLTEMLRAIDLDREQVFITNVVKCRPPDNREPKSIEVETCKAYLLRQHALIKPKIILALGHVAAQALLNTDESIAELRGKIHTLNDTPVVVTYHPAHLLRSLLDKHKAWADLKFAMQIIKNHQR